MFPFTDVFLSKYKKFYDHQTAEFWWVFGTTRSSRFSNIQCYTTELISIIQKWNQSTSFHICIVFDKFLRDRQCKPFFFFFLNIDTYFPLRGIHMRLPRIAVQKRKLILSWICRTCHRKLCFLYFSIMKSHLNNHLPFSFWLGVDREAQENYKDSLDDMKLYTTLLCNSPLLLKEET